MNHIKLMLRWLFIVALWTGTQSVQAQSSALVRLAAELVEAVVNKGGKAAAKELVELGGEAGVREVLETASREGGEQLVRRLASVSGTYGTAILQGAKISPTKFLAAFEGVEPALREAALQGVRRNPNLMARMVAEIGQDALIVEARHPGIGLKVLQELGAEGARAAGKLTIDQAAQLGHLAKAVGGAPAAERRALLELIAKAPEKTMALLEKHPNVLRTGTALAAFLASKEELFGNEEVTIGPDGKIIKVGKPGFISGVLSMFQGALTTLLFVVGAVFVVWAGIKIWGTYRITRAKIDAAEKQP